MRAGRAGPAWRAALAALFLVAGCASAPPLAPVDPAPVPAPPPASPAGISPATLPGWTGENHLAALDAYAAGCGVARDPAGVAACRRGRALEDSGATARSAREFFETNFTVVASEGEGRLTAYFAPEYEARRTPQGAFDTPVVARPADLVVDPADPSRVLQRRADGSTGPYPDRAAIEASPPGEILAWMKAEELFFMQLQGSGYLTFEDGGRGRAAYAANNGLPFVAIANRMVERGLLPAGGASGEAIRAWLAAHRGPEADAVTALNPRYVFFAMQPDDGGDPAGAAGVPLTARRSIAVDPASWRYGDLVWIQAEGGGLIGARDSYRGLMMALDTGSAIRGPVRADFYMGHGAAAGEEAGTVRHPLRMWRLVPKP